MVTSSTTCLFISPEGKRHQSVDSVHSTPRRKNPKEKRSAIYSITGAGQMSAIFAQLFEPVNGQPIAY